MCGDVILVLQNWEECGFKFQIEISFDDSWPRHKYHINHQCYYYGVTHHTSLQAAKAFIRLEYAVVKKTPKFKWAEPQEIKK